jgi:hypothetical protein
LSKSILCRLSMPVALLVGGVLLSGCSGEENIPLKKVDFVLDTPKDFKETRKGFTARKGSSAGIGHDPSGVNRSGMDKE